MVSPCKEVALEEFLSRSPLIHIDKYLLSLLPRVLPVSHDSLFLEVSAQPEIIRWIVFFDENVSLHRFGTSRMLLFTVPSVSTYDSIAYPRIILSWFS